MIGRLNQRVSVFKKVRTSNERGGIRTSNEFVGLYWAEIQALRSTEVLEYKKLDIQASARIFMRANEELSADCIIIHNGFEYEVEAITVPLTNGNYISVIVSGGR